MEKFVFVSNRMYKNIKRKCKSFGFGTVTNKYGVSSTVTLVNGDLIDSDGNRKVVSNKMMEENAKAQKLKLVITNPMMKDIFDFCKKETDWDEERIWDFIHRKIDYFTKISMENQMGVV
jgi:hypothetical protein